VRSLAQFDPDLKRPYQLAFNAGITHEVLTGLTASFEYFRSDFRNITVRQNVLRTAASYDEFTIASPLDGSSIPVWLPKPGVASQVANVDSTSDDMKRAYNGFDMSFNALRGGVRALRRLQPRADHQRRVRLGGQRPEPQSSATSRQRHSVAKQVKATVVYPLPWRHIRSARAQGLNGYVGHRGRPTAASRPARASTIPEASALLPDGADDALRGELQGRVHAERAGAAGDGGQRRGVDQRAARRSGDQNYAHQPARFLGQQVDRVRDDSRDAAAGPVHPSTRMTTPRAVRSSAPRPTCVPRRFSRPHHPLRCRREW
jgi:hypothetical protein